jgi:transcriptional regulator with XRE-family HTH domain
MDLISPEQCRAARALLNWSQPELAEKCGMHPQTISSFEAKNGSPTRTTLTKILEVFTRNNIKFLPNHGVCISDDSIYVVETFLDLLNDAQNTLSEGGEILLHCADERRSSQAVIDKYAELNERGITTRSTICEGNNFVSENKPSRWIPKDYFADSEVFAIYADKVSICVDNNQPYKSLVICNAHFANAMRRQFEYWWKNGKDIPQ